MNLPAYLQNKTRVDLNTVATAGMGGALPPHISIRGNSYTLIDANGAQQPLGPQMYACVIDILGVMGKRYYENDWTPGSDEPPTCWSTNGVGPSRESVKPQSRSCAECEWNVRGSETSKISGKGIKACRDEKIVALLLPQYPGMLFQLVIPPGSFKNWSGFTKPFENSGMDVSDVLISFGFQPQVNGVMTFDIAKDAQGNGVYMPEHLVPIFNKAIQTKATDILVGRNDVPIDRRIAYTNTVTPGDQPEGTYAEQERAVRKDPLLAAPYGNQPAQQAGQFGGAQQTQVPFGAGAPATNVGAFDQPVSGNVQPAATTSPSEVPRRPRRTRDQIAADNAAKAAQAGTLPPQPTPAPVQPQAPFPVQQNPQTGFGAAPAAPQGGFGSAQTQAPFGAGAAMNQPTATAQPSFNAGPAPNAQSPSSNQSFGIQQGADPNVDPQLAAMLATLGT